MTILEKYSGNAKHISHYDMIANALSWLKLLLMVIQCSKFSGVIRVLFDLIV